MNIQSILAKKGNNVVTIRPQQTIRDAIATLRTNNIGALVVINTGGEPIGILSERDIIRVAATDEAIFPRPVSALMTRDVIVGMPLDDLEAVAYTMTERHIRHVPVVDHGKLVGIVSLGDVVKAQRDQYQGELYTLQIQILTNEL
jgi:CBS domain-containing protein